MASSLLLTSHSFSLLFYKNLTINLNNNNNPLRFRSISNPNLRFRSLTTFSTYPNRFSSSRLFSTLSGASSDENSSDKPEDSPPSGIVDEWGEKAEPEPETAYTKLADADPPKDEDEWGKDEGVSDVKIESGNGSPSIASAAAAVATASTEVDKVLELKRCLVDSVYGTNLGFDASSEVRAEVLELVNQLEAANPTPAPTEAPALLDGNWVLLYTAFSELLPLLAVGTTPLLKVERITQAIDTSGLTIVNSTTLSSPFATFSFSASANFEVRSPSRIQVEFKEGTLQPPEIKSSINLPENVDIFGQKINLLPVQQSLNPLQEAVATVSRAISGLSPFKVPIPGNRTQSWLLTTFLDEDLRISRGDGGLFVLAKEGSPLLNQY